MTTPSKPSTADQLAASFGASIDWWREAGVEHIFDDNATEWLGADSPQAPAVKAKQAVAERTAPPPPPPIEKIGGPQENWPKTLEAFSKWWCEAKEIDDGGMYPRIAPRGPEKPELMIIVAEPSAGDKEELLSGTEGGLLTQFLIAAGIDSNATYFASVLPRHTPLPNWDDLQTAGIGAILMHHIQLVSPKRIITFGRNIPPLLNHTPTHGSANLFKINQEGSDIPLLVSKTPAALLLSPTMRKAFWHHWLKVTEDSNGEAKRI